MTSRYLRVSIVAVSAFFAAVAGAQTVSTTEQVLYVFPQDGASQVHASLIQAWDGNFYGLALNGDNSNPGALIQATPGGTVTSVQQLTTATGDSPMGGVVAAPDGTLYATPTAGGTSADGTAIQATTAGNITTLYNFAGTTDGEAPSSTPILGSDGNFYGTTYGVKYSNTLAGTIFQLTPSGTLTTLYSFCSQASCTDGSQPGALLEASDGNFYGTTYGGGSGNGVVFQYSPSTSTYTVLYTFTGAADGGEPEAQLTEGADGNLYGTTFLGGANGVGTIFQINLSTLAFTTMTSFQGNDSGDTAPLYLASDGNFYSTAEYGGPTSVGSFYQYVPGGAITDLWDFGTTSGDGTHPTAGVLQAQNGTFYGTTFLGPFTSDGPGTGTFYSINIGSITAGPLQITVPATAVPGTSQTISFQANNAFSNTMQQCYLYSSTGGVVTALGKIPGTLASGVFSGSTTVTPSATGTVTYAVTCGGSETATASQTVANVATTTTLTSNSPISEGSIATFTATVTAANSQTVTTGNVSLNCAGLNLGTQPVSNGVAVFQANSTGAPPGTYSCTATYAGSGYLTSSGKTSATVTNQSSTTTVTSASYTYTVGQHVTITANVQGQNITVNGGTVTFSVDNVKLATATVKNGQASFSANADYAAGTYKLVATYSGTPGTNGSSGNATFTLTSGGAVARR